MLPNFVELKTQDSYEEIKQSIPNAAKKPIERDFSRIGYGDSSAKIENTKGSLLALPTNTTGRVEH